MGHLLSLMGFLVVWVVVLLAVQKNLNRRSPGSIEAPRCFMRDTLSCIWRVSETRKRILLTLGTLALLQLLFFIPLPGVDFRELLSFHERMPITSYVFLTSTFSVGCLWLTPFLYACVLLLFTSLVIPPLRRAFFGGQEGREKVIRCTYYVTLGIALVQAVVRATWIIHVTAQEGFFRPIFGSVPVNVLAMALVMTAGAMLFLAGAELINRYGLGNGVPLIVFSSLAIRIPYFAHRAFSLTRQAVVPSFSLTRQAVVPLILPVAWCVILSLSGYLFFLITRSERSFGIRSKRGSKFFISIRPAIIGLGPLYLTMSMIGLPDVLRFAGRRGTLMGLTGMGMVWMLHYAVQFLLLAGFVLLYLYLVFPPGYTRKLLDRYGCSLDNDGSTSATGGAFKCAVRYVMGAALFLVVVYFLPLVYERVFNAPYSIATFIGGVPLLLMAGVFKDLSDQLEFFRIKCSSGIPDWDVCYITIDEMESGIIKQLLDDNGIKALVKPYRYSWGMPIRTAIDQYQVYVPAEKKEQAGFLISV